MSYFARIQSCRDYLVAIAEGEEASHSAWSKIGYNPAITTTEEDLWSAGGLYGSKAANLGRFPAAASTLNVSSGSASDTAVAIRGTLPSTPLTCDVGGTTTRLVDVSQDFNAATAVAIGDILIVDPYETATAPEWAIITGIDAGGDYIDFAGGLSSGGSCVTARKYFILDTSATVGAMAVKIDYLDAAYTPYAEIVPLAGASAVLTKGAIFRINAFRVIAVGTDTGTTGNSIGAISIVDDSDATLIWGYITAGFTRSRNNIYTVPLGKTLYINEWNLGAASPNDTKVQTIRVMLRANREPSTAFLTGNLFHLYLEALVTNGMVTIPFKIPSRYLAKTDIKVSAIGITAFSGPVTSVLRGWLE